MEKSLLIGIDPDTDKSGVAVRDKSTGLLTLHSWKFFELMDYLTITRPFIHLLKVEAGWLNEKSNFRPTAKKGAGERIAKNVGSNHETGRKIVEMCEHLGIKYQLVKPLRKMWKGPDQKITHQEFEMVTRQKFKKTNQEERDAGLLTL